MIHGRYRVRFRPINDLVKFTPIKPDAAAFRAIVNFDPVSVSHHQGFIIYRTFHLILSTSLHSYIFVS